MRVVNAVPAVLLSIVIAPMAAGAQSPAAAPSAGRVEVSAGGGWSTGSALGGAPAALRGRGGGDFALFQSESRFGAGPVLDVRASYTVSRRSAVEARFGFSRPELQADISSDVEGAAPVTLSERLDRYIIDAAFVILFGDSDRRRWLPFASAGAGYLRELHEGRTLVEQGMAFHAGGGLKHAFMRRERGRINSAGIRADARLYFLTEGAAGDARHVSATAGVFLGF